MSKIIKIPRVFGTGIDIQEVVRMERFFKGSDYMKKRFLTGIFNELEIEEYKSRDEGKARMQYVASRWALKEALVKASGQTNLSYPDIFLEKYPNRVSTE